MGGKGEEERLRVGEEEEEEEKALGGAFLKSPA